MQKRAEQVDVTRRRIVDATVHLHGTVGPAETTIAGIAERAGVTRLTVYRHFPDDTALFAACSTVWLSQQQLPDPEAWARIEDPVARLRTGLADLYRFYRQGESMLTLLHRDLESVPAMQQQLLADDARQQVDLLLAPFAPSGARRRRLRAVLGHAISFQTWRSLCREHGLSDRDAVDAMTTLAVSCLDSSLSAGGRRAR